MHFEKVTKPILELLPIVFIVVIVGILQLLVMLSKHLSRCQIFLLSFANVTGEAFSGLVETFSLRACNVKHFHIFTIIFFGLGCGHDLTARTVLIEAHAKSLLRARNF